MRSVSASWKVPRILGSPQGGAATWIGVEGPPAGLPVTTTAAVRRGQLAVAPPPSVPFIQVGTQAMRFPTHRGGTIFNSYVAFWSDTNFAYELQAIEGVRPGDEVTARLTLAAHRWTVSFSDLTSKATRRFTTTDQGHGHFNEAEWLEEDILPGPDGNPAPLPALSPTHVTHVAVNGTQPRYRDLQSVWMSQNGKYLAPSPFTADAFSIGTAALGRAGIAYLDLVEPDDRAARTFAAQLATWTPTTPRSKIVSESSTFARALRRTIHGFAVRRWRTAAGPIGTLERRSRALLALTNFAALVAPSRRAAWGTKWRAAAMGVQTAGLVAPANSARARARVGIVITLCVGG